MVTSRNDTGHDNRIDKTASYLTSRLLENDGKWTGAGVTVVEILGCVRDVEADD